MTGEDWTNRHLTMSMAWGQFEYRSQHVGVDDGSRSPAGAGGGIIIGKEVPHADSL